MNTELSGNYYGDGHFGEDLPSYIEDSDGFVVDTGYGDADCDTLGGEGISEFKGNVLQEYDFSQHPLIVRQRALKLLEMQQSQDRNLEPKSEEIIAKDEFFVKLQPSILSAEPGKVEFYFKGTLGTAIVQIQGVTIEIGTIQTQENQQGYYHSFFHGKGSISNKKISGKNLAEIEKNMREFIYAELSKIFPEDFPPRENNIDETPKIEGEIDGLEYRLLTQAESNDITVEFEYAGMLYSCKNLVKHILGGKEIYFLCPTSASKNIANSFRKRIGATGKDFEDAIQKMMKNILRVLKGQKQIDRDILDFFESIKTT